MKLNAKSEYALRAMLDLATRPLEQTTLNEIALRQSIPPAVLPAIFQLLARAGLVETVRGYHGGVRLGRPAAEVSVRMVFEALEGPLKLHRCDSMQGSCGLDLNPQCPLRGLLEETRRRVLELWGATSLAELARQHQALTAATTSAAEPLSD